MVVSPGEQLHLFGNAQAKAEHHFLGVQRAFRWAMEQDDPPPSTPVWQLAGRVLAITAEAYAVGELAGDTMGKAISSVCESPGAFSKSRDLGLFITGLYAAGGEW